MRILLLALTLLGLTACQDEKPKAPPPAKPVKSMVLGKAQSEEEMTFIGAIQASIKANLSFEVSGKLKKLPILEGQVIEKGQLLASLDKKRFEDLVFQANAQHLLDIAQFSRAEKLIKKHFISQAEYDILKSKMKISQANLRTANKDLSDTNLIAPFEGIVAKVYVENHEYVKAKERIMRVHDLSMMDVEIQVPEYIAKQQSRASKTKDNNYKAYASFDEFPQLKFPLTFKEYSSKADQQTQTFRVVYTMKSPDKVNVLPGMSANVIIILPDFKNLKKKFFLIPSSAVFSNIKKEPHVWLIDPKTHKLKAQAITANNLTGNEIKVSSGLKKGDHIVTAGVHFLQEGQQVKPLGNTMTVTDED